MYAEVFLVNEEELRAHLSASTPGGHGLDGATIAGMPGPELQARHDSLHADGADHGHPAPTGERSELPIRDGLLVRALPPTLTYEDGESVRAVDLTTADEASGLGRLMGRFAVFDQWTEVRSMIEGHFMERTGEGAFAKTLRESRPPIIFNHGFHPHIGALPLAPTEEIGEDTRGGFYAGDLLDTAYNRELVPGLRANLYGSSYRFRTTKQDFIARPRSSAYNPQALPEITVREAALREVGPTMFAVYGGTTATVRSQTDDLVLSRFGDPEQLNAFISAARGDIALPGVGAGESHSDEGSRSEPPPTAAAKPVAASAAAGPPRFRSRDEWLAYLEERPHRNA